MLPISIYDIDIVTQSTVTLYNTFPQYTGYKIMSQISYFFKKKPSCTIHFAFFKFYIDQNIDDSFIEVLQKFNITKCMLFCRVKIMLHI